MPLGNSGQFWHKAEIGPFRAQLGSVDRLGIYFQGAGIVEFSWSLVSLNSGAGCLVNLRFVYRFSW